MERQDLPARLVIQDQQEKQVLLAMEKQALLVQPALLGVLGLLVILELLVLQE
jgi:hypothetical protein